MMRYFLNAIHYRIPHIHIRRRHIDFGTQDLGTVRKLPLLHPLEQIQIFLRRTIPKRAFDAGLGQSSPVLTNVFGALIIDIGLSILDQLLCPFIHFIEIVGSVIKMFTPFQSQPFGILYYGPDILVFFFARIRIVEPKVEFPIELLCHSVINPHGFSVADM